MRVSKCEALIPEAVASQRGRSAKFATGDFASWGKSLAREARSDHRKKRAYQFVDGLLETVMVLGFSLPFQGFVFL